VNLSGLPLPGVLREGYPPRRRVDVQTSGLVRLDAGKEPLGIDLAGEAPGALLAVRV